MDSALIRLRLFIGGSVQGVGYRFFARRKALEQGVTGWVRNRDDGRVEVEVQGDRHNVEAFIDRLREGPSTAVVSRVDRQEIPVVSGDHGFEIAF
jgi:acylphosphatase